MWTSLRKAAESTVPTNIEVYRAHEKEKAREYSHERTSERLKVAGLGTGLTGIFGIMGVAAANQAVSTVAMYAGLSAAQSASLAAAGLATSAGSFTTALASVGTTLAGLGSVAVAGASLPAATVVALGTAVAGVAVMGLAKGYALAKEALDRKRADTVHDRASFDPQGRAAPSLKNYVQGTKQLIVRGIQRKFGDNGPRRQSEPSVLSAEAIAMGEAARAKGVREDQIPKFVQAAQAFIDQAKHAGIDLPALKVSDPAAPSAPTIAAPERTKAPQSGIGLPQPDKAPKR